MASPVLKTTGNANAPRRVLLNSGVVPSKKVTLMGSNGQTIKPRTPSTTPATTPPQTASDTEEATRLQAEAQAAAEAEAARLAEEEYQRQMEEYQRQMEEYNKALAAQQEEEARLKAEAEAKAKAEAEAKAKAEAEARAKAEAEAKARAEEEARKQAEAQIKARLEAEKARLEAEAMAKLAAEAMAKAQAAAAAAGETLRTTTLPKTAVSTAKKPTVASPIPKTAVLKQTSAASPAPAASGLSKPGAKPIGVSALTGIKGGNSKLPAPSVAKPASVPRSSVALPGRSTAHALPKRPNGEATPPAAAAAPPAEPTEGTLPPPAEMTEEQLAERDAYLAKLQKQAGGLPVWKRPIFYIAFGSLLVLGGISTWYVTTENAKTERIQKKRENIRILLHRASDINRQQIESLADAQKKNYKIECSIKDAKTLLDVVVDPFIKTESGSNLLGNSPERVAQNACVLLGIAAEQDPAIAELIFKTLKNKAQKISTTMYRWQLQRLALSNLKNANAQFEDLANAVSSKPNWPKKSEILSAIWETMGLRVTEKDVDTIVKLLKSKDTDGRLAKTLSICLDNIAEMTPAGEAKKALGDKIFEEVPEEYRKMTLFSVASCCSPKALAFYKAKLGDTANWKDDANLRVVSAWGDDSIIDYVMELQEKAKGDAKLESKVRNIIGTLLCQNRERSVEDVKKLISIYLPDAYADTSELKEIISKTDKDSVDYVGDGAPELKDLKAKREKLEEIRKGKMSLIKMFGSLVQRNWTDALLSEYAKDADVDVSISAREALENTKKNKKEDEEKRAKYSERSKG